MKSSKVSNRHSTQRHFQRHTVNPKPTIYYLLRMFKIIGVVYVNRLSQPQLQPYHAYTIPDRLQQPML